ncbi:MAG: DUF2256 domain-containing protein [Alphaproteobacteria bacterium]|nr:DUF2256 domain-containing protein [Alphaproteobacteria bacterium]
MGERIRMGHKRDQRTKVCPTCGRPFSWRRRWAECWDAVKFCSERCRRNRNLNKETNHENHVAH